MAGPPDPCWSDTSHGSTTLRGCPAEPCGDGPGRQTSGEEGALSVLSNPGQATQHKSAVTEPQELKLGPSLSCFNGLNS